MIEIEKEKKMISKIKKIVIALLIFSMPLLTKAQPPDIGEDPNYGVEDVHAPFDDGVSVLVAVAILYGLLRIRAYRKNEKNKEVLFQL